MALHPCSCGRSRFPAESTLLANGDQLLRRYAETCPDCGQPREFLFRLPDEPEPRVPRGQVWFGGDQPSELIDAAQWLWVAERYAGLHAADPRQMPPDELPRARADLAFAVAAMDEAAKFLPPGDGTVPDTAIWSDRGRELYRREPFRFRRAAIDAVREAYRADLARLGQP
jgi:hypothetical protein